MATLEKIRSKSVLVLIIIGAGLLAFIIGDFFTGARTLFGTGTTVAKVGSQKIDIQDFQREIERANQQVQANGQKVDPAMLQQQVLEGMISEKLYTEELNKLGLVVTDAELTEMMLGRGAAQLNAMIQQQTGIASAAQVHDMAVNPAKYQLSREQGQQILDYWMSLEKQTEQMMLQGKFNNLFAGIITANQLDAKALYEDNATTTHLTFARKAYTDLPDDKYEVTDADLQKEWEAHKQRYAIDEDMRTLDYIAVDIVPSPEDIAKGEKKVEDALMALKEKEGLEGIAEMAEFLSDRRKAPVSKLNANGVRQFADSAAVGSVKVVNRMGNDFTLAKLFSRSAEVDSANIDMVMVQGDKAAVDSVLSALRGGLDIDSLGRFASVQGAQDSVWVSMLDPQLANYRTALSEAAAGTYFVADTASVGGGMIFRVNSRKAPVSVVDMALIEYNIEPSAATVNSLQAKLQQYITANDNAKAFADNAQKAGYQVFPARVTPSTPSITGLNDSREVVAWAMKSKTGKVSPIFGSETTGRFIAAAVTGAYEDYIPATDPQVKQMLTEKVRNNKKAEALIAQYKGKANDIAGYAKLMGVSVDTTQVTFGQISLMNPGFAGAEVAAIASISPKGTLTAPVKGNNGVVVMYITDQEKTPRPFDYTEYAALFNRTRGFQALSQQFNLLLKGNKKITNNILKFFQN